jgi:hypothetical protein
VTSVRIFFVGGLTSYRALFSWMSPWIFVPTFMVAPIFQILLFAYIGRTAHLESDRCYVIGNALQYASLPCLFAMANTIAGERNQQTLGAILASPAPRRGARRRVLGGRRLRAAAVLRAAEPPPRDARARVRLPWRAPGYPGRAAELADMPGTLEQDHAARAHRRDHVLAAADVQVVVAEHRQHWDREVAHGLDQHHRLLGLVVRRQVAGEDDEVGLVLDVLERLGDVRGVRLRAVDIPGRRDSNRVRATTIHVRTGRDGGIRIDLIFEPIEGPVTRDDWAEVRLRIEASPMAKAFFTRVEERGAEAEAA